MMKSKDRVDRRLLYVSTILGLLFSCICFILLSVRREYNYSEKASAFSVQTEEIEEKRIALTFDDGPHPINTPILLEGLRERGVLASFFVIGEHAKMYPEIIEDMYEDGHFIGNHTYHHISATQVEEEIFLKELEETNYVMEEITGEEVHYVRPPFGHWSSQVEEASGMLPVFWNIDPRDWCTEDVDAVVNQVVKEAEHNGIILLHDKYETSVEAALIIVDELQEMGFEFVTVDEIIMP